MSRSGPQHSEPPRGLFPSAALWGVTTAGLHLVLLWGATHLPAAGLLGGLWIPLLTVLMVLAFPLLPITFLGWGLLSPAWARRCILVAALVFGLGYCAMAPLGLLIHEPSIDDDGSAMFRPSWPVFQGVVTLATVGIWLFIAFLRRTSRLHLVPRCLEGCNLCGYRVPGLKGGAPCPGCGRTRAQPPAARPIPWAIPPRRLGIAVGTMALALMAAGPLMYRARWNADIAPLRSKLAVLHPDLLMNLARPGPGDNSHGLGGHGALVRFRDGSKRGLAVFIVSGDLPGLPAVRIYLAEEGLMAGDSSLTQEFVLGMEPAVHCDLNPAQAAALLRDGIPPGLVGAFQAAGAGSQSTGIWLSTEDLENPARTARPIVIDAAAFLGP